MADEPVEVPSTDVDEIIGQAIARINQDSISWEALKEMVTQPAKALEPAKISPPAQITKSEREALERLPDVFGVVVPTEVRALEPKEIDQLLSERQVLKTIKEMAAKRIDDGIRTTVLNHNDTLFAEGKSDEELAEADRTKDGHYVAPGKHPGEGENGKQFSVEPTKGKAQMDPNALKALSEDPEVEWFTHEDYLAMTTQTRVFDEAKVMLLLKRKPELVRAVREATIRSNPTVAVWERKA